MAAQPNLIIDDNEQKVWTFVRINETPSRDMTFHINFSIAEVVSDISDSSDSDGDSDDEPLIKKTGPPTVITVKIVNFGNPYCNYPKI